MNDEKVIIKMTLQQYRTLQDYLLKDEKESICWLLGKSTRDPQRGVRIHFIHEFYLLDEEDYVNRTRTLIRVNSDVKNGVYYDFINSDYDTLINCHSHPFDHGWNTTFSATDDRDDRHQLQWCLDNLPKGKDNVDQNREVFVYSLVMGQYDLDIRGYRPYNFRDGGRFFPVDEVSLIGYPFTKKIPYSARSRSSHLPERVKRSLPERLFGPFDRDRTRESEQTELYDRQVRAFGQQTQNELARVSVAIVGAGGIGSILAEQLLRIGIRKMTIIDDDLIETTNLNRWQYGRPRDVGRAKSRVLVERLRDMFPDADLKAVEGDVYRNYRDVALSDWVFSCLDSGPPRAFLNQLAMQYMLVLIDGGTLLHTQPQPQSEVVLSTIIPGFNACMECSQVRHYDPAEVAKAFYSQDVQEQLRAHGYIDDEPEEAAPAVMPINGVIASLMAHQSLELVHRQNPFRYFHRMKLEDMNHRKHFLDHINEPEPPQSGCLICGYYFGQGDDEDLPVPEMEG